MNGDNPQSDATGRSGRPRTRESVEAAALALASGSTVEAAAKAAGVAVSTLKQWRRSAKFRDRVSRLRDDMTAAAVGRLSSTCTSAADKMASLIECPDPKVALAAAKAIIDSTLRGREQLELSARIAQLEQQLGGKS